MDGDEPPGKELIMTRRPLPTRHLPEHPNLDQLKHQAKELRDANPAFALHDAQLALAREYGFESWPKLKAFVDGATVRRLIEAVRGGRLDEVRTLLSVRPELAQMSTDNLGVVHHAVLARGPEMVRILMRHGANAREGVYPYRDATTAHAIARQSGSEEIVRIIEEEENTRRSASGRLPGEASPLHRAAFSLDADIVGRLLDEGAEPNDRVFRGLTPVDAAAHRWYQTDTVRAIDVIRQLLSRGAVMTPAAAVVLDNRDWLRAQHAEGDLTNHIEDSGGLLRIAVTHDRPEVLTMLLDWGLDPDERIRFTQGDENPAASWGMPLQAAAILGRYPMAEVLLERGADPNASIYASGDPVSAAYERGDARMIAILERHGGIPTAGTVAAHGSVDQARRMLAGETPGRVEGDDTSIAAELLSGAAGRGRAEIVRPALARVGWPANDPRWFAMLEQTLRHDSDPSPTSWHDSPHLVCFRLLLTRCDPNLRGRPTDRQQFGLTTLHNIVARGNLAPEERGAFARTILDSGARLDVRDNLLKSTPLGWACRWGQLPLVKLFLERGADPIEPDAEPWATPLAWASRGGHSAIEAELRRAGTLWTNR
jgi:ankyrin repeat protein